MVQGTLSVSDLLATTSQSVVQFGEQAAYQAIADDLAAHNALTQDMLAELAEPTSDRLRRYGGASDNEMVPVDEFGVPLVQKTGAGQNIGFKMAVFGYGIQFTRRWLTNHTPADLAKEYQAAKKADLKRIVKQLRLAIYTPTNNLSYKDREVDNVVLPVRALANADGTDLPTGPNGEVYNGATHTHYVANATLTAAALSATADTVGEHDIDGEVRIAIAKADENTVRGMSGFVPYVDARLTQPTTTTTADAPLAMANTGNRAIGLFLGYEVWVKPWVLATYPVAYRIGAGRKPLVVRTRNGQGLGELAMVAEHEHHPLRAENFEREFDVSVQGRLEAAVLDGGHGSYTAPTIP